ncbi:hypothetical protein SAMN04487926_1146 [Paraburkholderia steynii]|uniref:Uncharacterized protein n=1 Tax=Paraburkholderia steynii TaxID=1245441 RepID=A0A7Z7B983_9BURK|nr:hypothetical protein SAMN04487926_1146 [Paraburkholderia steynii]
MFALQSNLSVENSNKSSAIVPEWGVLRFVYRLVNNVYFVYTPRTLIQ